MTEAGQTLNLATNWPKVDDKASSWAALVLIWEAPLAPSEAAWETPAMLRATSVAPSAVCWTFLFSVEVAVETLWMVPTISEVVADCS